MNKFFGFIASAAVSLLSLTAGAQDRQIANHLSLGFTLGIDAVGAELVVPFSPYVQLRGGYSIFPYTEKRNMDLGSLTFEGKTVDMSNTPVAATLWKGGVGKVFLDLYPGRDTGFHITLGAFMGSGKVFNSSVDLRGMLEPEDYRVSVGYKGFKCSTDENGFAYLDAMTPKILPYIGIGGGRTLKPARRAGFTIDLGVAYTGGIKATTYDFSRSDSVQSYVITSADLTDENGKQTDKGIVDKIGSFPVLPILKFGVYFLLF